MTRPSPRHIVPLAILALFWLLAARDLQLPGLHPDEALQVPIAMNLVQEQYLPAHDTLGSHRGFWRGKPIPLMTLYYLGALKSYLLAPYLYLMGTSLASIRIATISFAALGLACTWLFANRLFGALAAAIGALLLATDTSFISYSRMDQGPTAIMMMTKMGALWLFVKAWQSGRWRWGILGAFVFGLGLSDKANFLWMVIALPVAGVLSVRGEVFRRIAAAAALAMATAFVAGGAMFFYYNGANAGESVAPLFEELTHPPDRAEPSTFLDGVGDFADRWRNRADLASALLLSGIWHEQFIMASHGASDGPLSLLPQAFKVSLVVLIIVMAVTGDGRKQILFLLLVPLLIMAQIALTPQAYDGHHLMMLYPFPHLIVGVASARLIGLAGRFSPWIARGVLLLLGVVILSSGARYHRYFSVLRKEQGRGLCSAGINQLAGWIGAYAESDSLSQVICMDGGIKQPLAVLTGGSTMIKSLVLTGQENDEEIREWKGRMAAYSSDPNVLYVFHGSELMFNPATPEAFAKEVSEREVEVLENVYQADGSRLFYVVRLSDS